MNSIESNFVPYQIAVDMKSIGFDEPCFAFYGLSRDDYKTIRLSIFQNLKTDYLSDLHHLDVTCDAQTFSQAFKFFRERYKLHSCIVLPINKIDYAYEIKNISENIRQDFLSEMQSGIIYSSYEKAELACIRKLIEIAKEQNVK